MPDVKPIPVEVLEKISTGPFACHLILFAGHPVNPNEPEMTLQDLAAYALALREALADLLRGCEETEDSVEDWPRYLLAKDNARALLGEDSDG